MTTLSLSTFHVNADGHLTCPIQTSIKEVMPVQTSTVPGAPPRPLLFQGSAPLKLSYLLAHTSDWGDLEHSRILTSWATHNFSTCGWEAFPTPGALTHIRITWVFSPSAPQSPECHSGVPLVPMVFRAFLMERCSYSLLKSLCWLAPYLESRTTSSA